VISRGSSIARSPTPISETDKSGELVLAAAEFQPSLSESTIRQNPMLRRFHITSPGANLCGISRKIHPIVASEGQSPACPSRNVRSIFVVMKSFCRAETISLALAIVMACRVDLAAKEPAFEGLGSYSRKITTESPKAQRYFNQGLGFYHGFNHGAAIRAFQEAARIDPKCAMAHWGIALANCRRTGT
jgi:hypothetical protein